MGEQGEYRNFAKLIAERQRTLSAADNPDIGPGTGNLNSNVPPERCDYCPVQPELSAKRTFLPGQAIGILLILVLFLYGLFLHNEPTVMVLAISFSGFYLAVVVFRALVLADFDGRALVPLRAPHQAIRDKTYVILAALYDEADQVRDLVESLNALRWNGSKKRVYLICEEKDPVTIAAVRRLSLPDGFELLIVPDGEPRTKPRALNYALMQVQGDYLVIYDAEDRPAPGQLEEAAGMFAVSPAELACLQAPLNIDNARESFLTRLFAIEYDTLFLGILPTLTKWRAPMPLGGTSNHFRMDALKRAGGWDSYNVTEDADLGIRLARFRLKCGTISSPTHEEAPARFGPWMRQRTRWIKGWMQTLLVHMRSPALTARQMGIGAFFKFHLVLTSVVVSVLVHPVFLVAFVDQMIRYFSGTPASAYDIGITAISAFNLVAGYSTYGFLAYTVERAKPKGQSGLWILLLPVYWLLISIAGWRALFKIFTEPHHWEKTPHGSNRRQSAGAGPSVETLKTT